MVSPGYPPTNILLILYCFVDVKLLEELGKEYPWPRPGKSPCCGGVRLWRHGFVPRYFGGYPDQLLMLRYRCADCGAVHTMRPSEYDRRFRAQWATIFLVLLLKILTGRWSSEFSKERQRYWLKGFRVHASRWGNASGMIRQLQALGELTGSVILGTHSTRFFEIRPYRDPPHLIFRLTMESRFQ
jgi:hypothetical protein